MLHGVMDEVYFGTTIIISITVAGFGSSGRNNLPHQLAKKEMPPPLIPGIIYWRTYGTMYIIIVVVYVVGKTATLRSSSWRIIGNTEDGAGGGCRAVFDDRLLGGAKVQRVATSRTSHRRLLMSC